MFYVYGISLGVAKKLARKKCSTSVGYGANRRDLSPTEYEQKLEELTLANFEKMKPQKLSHSLSTPTLCQQYIELAKTQEPHKELLFVIENQQGKYTQRLKGQCFLGKFITENSYELPNPRW